MGLPEGGTGYRRSHFLGRDLLPPVAFSWVGPATAGRIFLGRTGYRRSELLASFDEISLGLASIREFLCRQYPSRRTLDWMSSEASHRSPVNPVEVDAINYINIVLMVASVVIAAYVPFETFLIAYAVMGPLHYLTEISWLHDRRYFTAGAWDWVPLVAAAVLAAVGATLQSDATIGISSFALGALFVGAAGMVFARSGYRRMGVVILALIVGYLASTWQPLIVLFTAFLPTLLHVYFFTGLFLLHGALKGRTFSGLLSLVVFIAAPFVCMFGVSTPEGYSPSLYVLEAASPFNALGWVTLDLFGLPLTKDTWLGFMRLMGFAYAYHYLNWFSKTRIINWHQVSRARLSGILVVYLAALALYGFNYRWGFVALMTLSFAHVMLELPLNFRTASGVVVEVKERLNSRRT